MRTDASTLGIGGVIIARSPDGTEKPVCFVSKKFTPTQSRWSTIEQELYAILYTLTQTTYASLLKTVPVLVETGHLVYLDKSSISR